MCLLFHLNNKMNVQNPQVLCIYSLFKQHKPRNNYRTIEPNYSSSIANISVWLTGLKKIKIVR